MSLKIVVGLDGSSNSRVALDWTLANFDDSLIEPTVVYEISRWFKAAGIRDLYNIGDTYRQESEALISEMLSDRPGLGDQMVSVRGAAGKKLVAAAADSDLLVVGTRGRTALRNTLLGSVATYCVKHAKTATAVIPEGSDSATVNDVLVGVDGSDNSCHALEWAMENFASANIRAVRSYAVAEFAFSGFEPPVGLEERLREDTEALVDKAKVNTGFDGSISFDVRVGDPRAVLQVTPTDLLIVGAHGHRLVPFLDLGSTANAVVQQAKQPVIVVPDSETS